MCSKDASNLPWNAKGRNNQQTLSPPITRPCETPDYQKSQICIPNSTPAKSATCMCCLTIQAPGKLQSYLWIQTVNVVSA